MLLLCALIVGSSSARATVYEKITDVSDLVAGKKYLIVNSAGTKALGAVTDKNIGSAVDVTASDGKITISAEAVAELTLGGSTGAWTFSSSQNEGKLIAFTSSATSKNNNLWVVSSSSDNGATWTVTFSSGTPTIKNVYNDGRTLMFNNDRFCGYTSSQTAVALYREQEVVSVTGVTLNKAATSLEAGDTETLTATVSPSNATNKDVTWASDAPAVADVDENGVVTAKSAGTANITVTTDDGGKTATCVVTVTASVSPMATLSTTSLDFGRAAINEDKALTFTITPANLTSALSISCDNPLYVVTPTSIASDVTTETTITVTVHPTAKGNDLSGTITISDGGLASDKTVTLTGVAYDPSEITYDFSAIDFADWSTSYAAREVVYEDATVNFSSANKQNSGSKIDDIPVMKNGNVIVTLNNTGEIMKTVEFNCRQWDTKTQTLQLYSSTDGGTTWSKVGSDVTDAFSISSDALPANTNAVKLTTTNSSNQIGIKSVTFTIDQSNYNVKITTAQYATHCYKKALDFSSTDITVYKAKVDGSVVKLTEVTDGIVPAGEGVILYAETADTYTVPVTTTAATISDNELVGVTEDTAIDYIAGGKYNYILQKDGDDLVFRKATGAKLRANRAYLSTTYDVTAVGAPVLEVVIGGENGDDNTTGVSEKVTVESGEASATVYNLNGQRVSQPTKGLYIVNGKKVILK